MLRICRRSGVLLLLFWVASLSLCAQGLEYVKGHYTKYEYRIPMRDGTKLFTAVYAPKDTSEPYPILLTRTPYSVRPYGPDNYRQDLGPSEQLAREGFIFVYQDVRGRTMSEGEFVNMTPHKPEKRGPEDVDESTDAYDTIDWLVKHIPNHNGRVGMWGISYPGFYAAAGMIDAHPALKAVSPQAPIADWFVGDDFHHNGALYLPHAFGFLFYFGHPRPEPTDLQSSEFVYGTPDGYRFFLGLGPLENVNEKYFKSQIPFWNEILRHGTYDEFWQARNLLPHLNDIRPAVMTVGGWFDAEDLYGSLNVYKSIEERNPGAFNVLVMGPWFHGGWARSPGDSLGNARFNSRTSLFYRENIELPFFNFHLKDKGDLDLPEAFVFQTGANQWRRLDQWPPSDAASKCLYFRSGGALSFDPPDEDPDMAYDEYVSDPSKPVPHTGGITVQMTREHMVEDQRFAATRSDVLLYETEPLEADITIAGPIEASLYVSTTGTDSDWIVKLIDVYPDDAPDNTPNPADVRMGGFQQLLRGDVMRGKFRNSYEEPEPFVPGRVEKVEFTLNDVYHTFRRGHRMMVQVQSTWFPLVDRNPQQYLDIYSAKAEDFQKATQRVHRSKDQSSCVRVNVVGNPR